MQAIALLILLAADTDNAEMRKEMQKLEGTWKVVSAEADGKKLPAKEIPIETVIFKDGKVEREQKGALILVYTLDSAKSPKQIRAEPTGMKKDRLVGIYQLENEALRLCIGAGAKPPAEFKSDGKDVILLELKRVKKEQ